MASAAARDMAKRMAGKKSGGGKKPMPFAKKGAKPAMPMPAPAPVKMAVGGIAKQRLNQSTPAGKQKAPPRAARRSGAI